MAELYEVTRTAFAELAANILGHELSDAERSRVREFVVVRGVESFQLGESVMHSYGVSFPHLCMYDDVADAFDNITCRLRKRLANLGRLEGETFEVWHVVDDPEDSAYPEVNPRHDCVFGGSCVCDDGCDDCPVEVVSDVTLRGAFGTFRGSVAAPAHDVFFLCAGLSALGVDCVLGTGMDGGDHTGDMEVGEEAKEVTVGLAYALQVLDPDDVA